ncbi:MAG TPA: helix-turn-helix domain-containing protein [Xanthomonadaceae bacterium]|nr:helix-turn-helix domain-containing protein [Xanthomonadaceae bacterium]
MTEPATDGRGGFELGILALDGAMLTSIGGPLDALRVAQRLGELRDPAHPPRLSGRLIGVPGCTRVRTAVGVSVGEVGGPDPLPDVLLVPGLMHQDAGDLLRRLHDYEAEIALLRALHLKGVRIVAACSGTVLLAASGLLDGREATTSWWLADAFRRAFPAVRLQADRMLVEHHDLVTAGAANAVMLLSMRVLAQATDEHLAQHTARMLMVDTGRQSQAPYVVQALVERPRDSLTERVERFLQHELHGDLSVARVAEHCGTSERSLLRHFRATFGVSPLQHIQRLRVERAKALLETTHLSLDEIVGRCGYADPASFRKLFKRATALTPTDYRSRFRLRVH